MTREEAIDILFGCIEAHSEEENEALDMAIEALKNKSRPFGDCSKCIHTYGTLGCCTTVSNEWVYDCEHGMERYKSTSVPSADRPTDGDLISRAEAIEALGEEPLVWCDEDYEIAERSQWRDDVEAIKSVPSADRPRGEWINDKHDMPRCSECGYMPEFNEYIDDYFYSDFCPNCGADMRGEEE